MKSARCSLISIGMLLWGVLAAGLCVLAAEEKKDLLQMPLRMGFTQNTFLNLNVHDVETSFKVFTQTVGKKRGYDLDVRTRVYDKLPEFIEAIKNGEVQMAVLSSLEYLEHDIGSIIQPRYVHTDQGCIQKEYLLLTKCQSGFDKLMDLQGKDIGILESSTINLSLPWLETLLLENGHAGVESFFRKIESVGKPSAAVLPVFFGKRPACVVDRSGFQTMVEMNPQVGKALQTIAVSKPFVSNIICMSRTGWVSDLVREDISQALAELHLEPSGRQILLLFKIDKLVPFKEEYLDALRSMKSKRSQLLEGSNQ